MKYITYSRCFIFLDLLQYEFFRNELDNPEFIRFLKNEVYSDWSNVSGGTDDKINTNPNINDGP